MNAQQEKEMLNKQPAQRNITDENYSIEAQECCRDSAKKLLDDRIKKSYKKAQDLQILFDMLPTSLTREQDNALWSILQDRI